MIPLSSKKAVRARSGDLCEFCKSPRWLQFAHILHRKMGGRHGEMAVIIHDPRNIAHLCRQCHDVLDRRIHDSIKWIELGAVLLPKIGWDEWWSKRASETNLRGGAQE
jgi:hypothetical protein